MGLLKWSDDMDRKVMILLYLVTIVFTTIDAKSARHSKIKSPFELTPDDEDYNEASGQETGDYYGFLSRSNDDFAFQPDGNDIGYLTECEALQLLGVPCPTSVPEITSSTVKKAESQTPIVHTTVTLPTNDITKIPANAMTATRFDVVNSNDPSDEEHSSSTLPETRTVGNSVTQPVKRQSFTEIDSTMTSDDAITSIESGRSLMPSSSSFTTRLSASRKISTSTTQVIIKTFTNQSDDISSASTSRKPEKISTTSELSVSFSGHSDSTLDKAVDTITTPLSVVSNNPHTIDVTEKDTEILTTAPMTVSDNIQPTSQAETLTSPRLVMLDDSSFTHSTLTTEKNSKMLTSLSVTTSSDETKYVRFEQRGSVEEVSTTAKFPSGRRADSGKGKPNPYATPRIVTAETSLPFYSTELAAIDKVGNVLTSTATRMINQSRPTEDSKSKYGTTSTARPSQRHGSETLQYSHTTEPDFDIRPAVKISVTPQNAQSHATSISTATAAGGTALLDLIMTTTTIPSSHTPPKKTPASEGNEVLLASTAFPTTIVIICVVAVVIALVIIIVLVVMCRGRMNKSGKYNISSEMNSMVGDESGDAKVVKVHYNDTNA